MAGNSTLDPDNLPLTSGQSHGLGHDIGSLGPSDTSDSGSDMKGTGQGVPRAGKTGALVETTGEEGSNSDSQGTGERASVNPGNSAPTGADIDVDRIDALNGD